MTDGHDRPDDETRTSAGPGPHGVAGRMPETIGPYRILGKLGEGGMGIVYEAEQERPRRRVALKVMRGGHIVDEAHAKMFQREAETLARLKHPNIGAIYEAGHTTDPATGTKHDYFAMELVLGDTLDAFLRKRGATASGDELEFRLRLFRQICDAVHYAHQRGVIHRDLKPSNIIVSEPTDSSTTASGATAMPQVKILDFGLARITDADVQAATVLTEVGQIKGTLPYMSPEQARGEADAIDVRTDVYALGVIGYEMIAGSRPYDLGSAALLEAVRVICKQQPRSLRQTISGQHRLDPDVETIVGKALEKEPDRRYSSAAALSDDVARYLTSQPIQARPPSATYQIRKFARRNKGLVIAASAVMAALVVGLVGTAWGFRKARVEATRSAQVATFMQEMLGGVAPAVAQGEDTTLLRRVLDDSAARVENELVDQPAVAAALHSTIGQTYSAMGDFDEGERHLQQSLDLTRSVYGENDPKTLEALLHMGVLVAREGRAAEAERIYQETLQQQREVLGDEHPLTLQTRGNLGVHYALNGRAAEAVPILEEVLAARRGLLGDDDPQTLVALNSLGVALMHLKRFDEAEPLLDEALERGRRVHGETHPDTTKPLHNLAGLYQETGRTDEAVALYTDSLEIFQRVLGDDHPSTLNAMNNLGVYYTKLRRLELAEQHIVEALEKRQAAFGPEHQYTTNSMLALAELRMAQYQAEEAERIYLEVLEIRQRADGERHYETIKPRYNLARLYSAWRRYEDSRQHFVELIEIGREVLGDDHPSTLTFLHSYGLLLSQLTEHEAAEQVYTEALEGRRRVLGDTHPYTLISLNTIAVHYMNKKEYEKAVPFLQEALAGQLEQLGPDHPDTLISRFNLGGVHYYQGEYDEAEALFVEALEGFISFYGPEHPNVRHVKRKIAELYDKQGRYDEAVQLQREVVEFSRNTGDNNTLSADLALHGNYLIASGDHAGAETALRECLEIRRELMTADDWQLHNVSSLLGAALTGQKRYDEAERLVVESAEAMLRLEATPPERRQEAIERVVRLYEAWGRSADSDSWRSRLN